jgi:pimeloyl-ACP methyl ester carboxylesterase
VPQPSLRPQALDGLGQEARREIEGAQAGTVTDPAWRAKPSWYLVTSEDRMIPPPAQHTMAGRIGATVSEVAASHSVYVSQPEAVATLIAHAAVGPAGQ